MAITLNNIKVRTNFSAAKLIIKTSDSKTTIISTHANYIHIETKTITNNNNNNSNVFFVLFCFVL